MDSLNIFKSPAQDTQGYKVNLKSNLPRKWLCPLCNLLMRDAIQTYRGEMACEACYLTAKGNKQICPLDDELIEEGEFFKDRHARREILQLECLCLNKNNGCNWEGVVNQLDEHKTNCNYEIVSCVNCLEFVQRGHLHDHIQSVCLFRKVECPHCRSLFEAQSLQEHEETCHMKPTECPFMCGEHVQLNNIYNHVKKCKKISSGHICPYQLVGCIHQPTLPDELHRHLQSDQCTHAALTTSTVKQLQESNKTLKRELTTEHTLRVEFAKKFDEQCKSQKRMEEDMLRWKYKFQEMETEFVKLQGLCSTGVAQVEKHLNEIDTHTRENSLQVIDAKLTEIGTQYDDVERKLRTSLATAESSSSSSGCDPQELKQGIAKIDMLESGSAVLNVNLSELELKLQLLENTSYEGKQLWKIDNVAYRINQAVTGSVSALHSAPCFQKRGGYKFCSRLYLNGDGMGRGTHVSLFFVVMKSEYDALLQWPFSERVTFRLLNPYHREESVRESFIPDKNSSSFKRPSKDMNIAAGCPMFIRRESLQKYIVDDVLYIETTITQE